MQLKDRCLVVIALITGRNFPNRPTYHLVCEAKFNNEVLSTDPVEHNEEPQFEQELAWDLDKTSLKQHRLQRSALKVTVSAVDSQSPVKEPIGFFMLDLRSCSTEKVYKWYRILHSKYKSSPAVFASIYLDIEGQELVPNPKIKTGLAMSLSEADLIPRVYNSEEDNQHFSIPTTMANIQSTNITWYTIGPRRLAKEYFMLTFQFEEAFKLESLIPIEQSLCSGEHIGGFHFTCELFGITIYSNQFSQLMQVKFNSIEQTFYIKSTVDILRIYFVHITPLVIKFCFGSHVLAHATVPVEQLIPFNDHILQNTAVLNKSFDLISEESDQQLKEYQSKHTEDKPRVNINITLRRYPDKNAIQQRSIMTNNNSSRRLRNMTDSLNHISSLNLDPYADVNTMCSNVNENYDQFVTSLPEGKTLKQSSRTLERDDYLCPSKLLNVYQSMDGTPNWHRYCYTIELRSVKNIQGFDHELQLYARYVYPLFGSGAPVMTLPPIAVARNQEVILPHGFCAFEFAASPEELKTRLNDNPLKVEFFDRSQGTLATDSFIGYSLIPLVSVFESSIVKATKESSTLVRRINDSVDMLAEQSNTNELKVVGQLVYSLQLEDFGAHNVDSNASVLDMTKGLVHQINDEIKSEPSDIRSTREYQVAIELELWRAAEEAKFTAQLKKREQTLMATLAEEWHKRDSQREIICRKKLSEYQALEEKLRNTLIELATRERQLTAGEAELVRLKQENARELEVRRKELNQQSQVQIRDLESQMKLEKKNSEHWKSQIAEWRSKYASLEEENNSLRNEINGRLKKSVDNKASNETPSINNEVARLTAELAVARATLSETECRLVEVERGRARYRQLWTKSLHELAKVKQEADEATRISLAQKEAELEQLKSYYLNVDEKRPTSQDLKEPTDGNLERSKMNEEMTTEINVSDVKSVVDEKIEAQITRLIEERDGLLNTGVYENSDSLIVDLDRQIRYLLGKI
ncbi:unnamed protein product [Schistosoma bovis]|nr:unnamed protein product [Schistosoma bovis]CAH8489007.1 unnamed protein product [Schistosoma bovis]